jgi:hypothetical protein
VQQPLTDTAIDLELEDVDDRPHLIPGFDRDDDTAEVRDGIDRTQVLPGSGDDTQVIPADDEPGGSGPARRRGGRPSGPNRPGRKRR